MTIPDFTELCRIIDDPSRTTYQKAADLHALMVPATLVPVRGVEPSKRKPRTLKPKPGTTTPPNGEELKL